MTRRHPTVQVLNPGGFSPEDWNVAGAEVELPDRLPGWRFRVSLSLRDGRVLGLAIDPVSSEAFEAGITTTKLLRVLPLEEMVAAIRAANAEQLMAWTKPRQVGILEVDEHGRGSMRRSEMTPTAEMRRTMREIAAPIRQNPKQRRRKPRLTNRRLAQEMLAYSTAVAANVSVAQFLKETHLNADTFKDHREKAIGRELFTSAGPGRAGGSLTSAGERALRDKE